VTTTTFTAAPVRHLHIEPTTRCNAACPMCARNDSGGLAPGLRMLDLDVELLRQRLRDDAVPALAAVDLCGAYGDPALHADLLGLTGVLREHSQEVAVTMFTNGGVRSTRWWSRLAEGLGERGRVVFAIDGLRDTLGTYRRDVSYDKVLANASAFIAAGGTAEWDFLVFRHNEHQVEEAGERAAALGFARFNPKHSARFVKVLYEYVPETRVGATVNRFPICGSDGSVVGWLEPPSTPHRNVAADRLGERIRASGSHDVAWNATSISCKVLANRSVFISAGGLVFPCCWTYVQATVPLRGDTGATSERQMRQLVAERGGTSSLDLRHHSLREIVSGDVFAAIETSWSAPTTEDGKLRVCARVCGEADSYRAQFADADRIPGGLASQA
jgi:MoaA/NifB/PqqE/SkfB family radical SAM enzyme